MKNTCLKLITICSTTLLLQACAHTATEKQIDEELAQENSVTTRSELYGEASKLIQSTPGLSAEQREKLAAISNTLKKDVEEMRSQSIKLRSLLVKHLIADTYDEDKVDLLKKRLRKLEDQRLLELFRAVEETKGILGHENIQSRRKLMDSFFEGNTTRD